MPPNPYRQARATSNPATPHVAPPFRLPVLILQMNLPGSQRLIATTTFSVEGYRITEYLGIVRGVVVRAPTISQGFFGGLRTIIGGHIQEYTAMCEQTRQDATVQMMDHARALGANGVVGIAYDASEIGQSATEVLCYGTAVRLEATGATD